MTRRGYATKMRRIMGDTAADLMAFNHTNRDIEKQTA
jgi:hypothetical protein